MSDEIDIGKIEELENKANKLKVDNFKEILAGLKDLDNKKRVLWEQIYENALQDRSHAYMMFTTLVQICNTNTTEHAVHGRSLSSYIEKMSKANDQIIRLASLIQKLEDDQEQIDPEKMFDAISNGKR